MLKIAARISLLLAISLLSACQADNLYIVHKTNLGLNGAYNQAKPSGKLLFGYKEQFITVIPKSVPSDQLGTGGSATGSPDQNREAMSVLSCSDVKTGFIELKKYSEYLATGRAAKLYAEQITHLPTPASAIDAARVVASRLQTTLATAAEAANKAVENAATGADTTALKALTADITTAQTSLSKVVASTDDTIQARLTLAITDNIQPLVADFDKANATAKDDNLAKAGQAVSAVAAQGKSIAAPAMSGGADKQIFDCLKDSQNS
jgi:hypothetical protein